jgi:hypothetical protein
MNDIFIVIIILISVLYYYKHRFKKIENFQSNNPMNNVKEKCHKNVYNKLSNGKKTFFSNEMIDTAFDLDRHFEKAINNNNESNDKLKILNSSVKSSTNSYNTHNDLYHKYNNNLESIFNELNRNMDVSKSLIDGKKMAVDSKFSDISNKVNNMVSNVKSSGIENKLKPIVTNQIDRQLVEKSTKAAEDYNVGGKMLNRVSTNNSKIYEWQFVEKAHSNAVLRINAETGDVECLSYDGKNCVNDYKSKYGNNMTNIKSDEVKSLQCGADHKRQWGMNGYDDTNHWCSKAYREFAKMGSENIDFNACPKDWSLIEPKTTTCIAPFDYKPPKEILPPMFEDSELLTSAQKATLRSWLPARTTTKLIYRGGRDGMNAGAFHNKVNGHGANITILKNNKGQLIGGYTSKDWGVNQWTYVNDDSTFLFSLDRNEKYTPLYPQHAIYTGQNYGPTFGGGHDLMIFGWGTQYGDCYHNPHSFNYNGSKILDQIHYNGHYTGMFRVSSIETWQVLSSSFSNSQIIGSNQSWQNSLNEWLGNSNKEVELLYRATRDGYGTRAFHRLCDNKGPTITLVRDDQGRCFGGYTAVSWNSNNGQYYQDNTAFMFSFNRNQKSMVKHGGVHAIYQNQNHYGPTFGGGHDMLLLYDPYNSGNNDPSWNGGANCLLYGYSYANHGDTMSGGGHYWFKAQEIEVWSYKEKTKAIAINDDRCKSRECVSLSVLKNIEQKQKWSLDYNARFPFKLNLGGITEKNADVSKKAIKEIDTRIGNTDKPLNASLENYKLYKNGIIIKTYKTDDNFTKGVSYNHEFLGANINFNWGTGIIMALPNAIKDYVYLEMIGYLKVPAKKVIFRIGSDDGVRLFLSKNGDEKNMLKLFDNWRGQSYTTFESEIIEVTQDAYLPFLLEYFEGPGDARLTLEWALDDNAVKGTNKYEIISSNHFYYDKSTCADNIKPINNFNDICDKQISENKENKYIYGSWIRNQVLITKESVTNTGEKVYIAFDDNYTKMVSQSGVGKYYKGPNSDYKPCDWQKYNNAPSGAYLIK